MRNLLLMFIVLTSSIMNAQRAFDFRCIDPAEVEAQRLADGLAAADNWTPPLGTKKSNFIQTKSFETVTATRTIEVTKNGGEYVVEHWVESQIVGAVSGNVGRDFNQDGDLYDGIWRSTTNAATYTTSPDIGSHSTPAYGPTGWQLHTDYDTPTGAYEYALDNQPGLDIFPDETWTRETYESRLRSIGEEVKVAYTLQTLLIDGEYLAVVPKYHTIKVEAWEWDNHYTKDRLQDLSWESWGALVGIVQREWLKLRYGIPQNPQPEGPTNEELAALRAERMQEIYDIGHGHGYDVYYEWHNYSDAFYPGTAFSLGIRVRTNDYGANNIEDLTAGGWRNYVDAWKAELYRYELWLRAQTCAWNPFCN